MSEDNEIESSRLLHAVRAAAISPDDANDIVAKYMQQARTVYPAEHLEAHQDRVAAKIVSRYAKLSSIVGGASGLVGIIPGLGTALAVTGGALGDAVATMKLQVDMSMCLAATYGYDLNKEDARNLALLISAGGTLEKAGLEFGARLASEAGVRLLRQYLRGAVLQAVKEFFKKLGIIFTRKALEKALPFGVGVALGSTANFYLTRYVGQQATEWFRLDRDSGGPTLTLS